MKSMWALDVVDIKKSMMKVHKHESTVSKTFFVPYLMDAKLHLNTLVAICKDCVWVIDVESSVRRRVSDEVILDERKMPYLVKMANLNLPEFLKKSA